MSEQERDAIRSVVESYDKAMAEKYDEWSWQMFVKNGGIEKLRQMVAHEGENE